MSRAIRRRQRARDAVYTLKHMGADFIYDFRQMHTNLVREFSKPHIEVGADALINGSMEAFTGNTPDGWFYVGVNGTQSIVTTLPWDSEGTRAWRIEGDEDYGGSVITQSIVDTPFKTYQIKGKLLVEQGVARLRWVGWTSWYVGLQQEYTPADGVVEFEFYASFPDNVTSQKALQIVNGGAGTPLTVVVDDFSLKPVTDDTDIHLNLGALSYDEGRHTDRYYEFGLGNTGAHNWNKDGQLIIGDENTIFAITRPGSTCYSIFTYWDASRSKKSYGIRFWPPTNDIGGIPSSDGSSHSQFYTGSYDPFSETAPFVTMVEYNGAGGSEEIRVNNDIKAHSYTSGAHVATLYDDDTTPFCIGALRAGSGSFIERAAGKFYIVTIFNSVLTEGQKEIANALMQLRR